MFPELSDQMLLEIGDPPDSIGSLNRNLWEISSDVRTRIKDQRKCGRSLGSLFFCLHNIIESGGRICKQVYSKEEVDEHLKKYPHHHATRDDMMIIKSSAEKRRQRRKALQRIQDSEYDMPYGRSSTRSPDRNRAYSPQRRSRTSDRRGSYRRNFSGNSSSDRNSAERYEAHRYSRGRSSSAHRGQWSPRRMSSQSRSKSRASSSPSPPPSSSSRESAAQSRSSYARSMSRRSPSYENTKIVRQNPSVLLRQKAYGPGKNRYSSGREWSQNKQETLICPYCQAKFEDHDLYREHMNCRAHSRTKTCPSVNEGKIVEDVKSTLTLPFQYPKGHGQVVNVESGPSHEVAAVTHSSQEVSKNVPLSIEIGGSSPEYHASSPSPPNSPEQEEQRDDVRTADEFAPAVELTAQDPSVQISPDTSFAAEPSVPTVSAPSMPMFGRISVKPSHLLIDTGVLDAEKCLQVSALKGYDDDIAAEDTSPSDDNEDISKTHEESDIAMDDRDCVFEKSAGESGDSRSLQELQDKPEIRPQSLDTRLTEMADKLPDSIKNLQMSSEASKESESTTVTRSLDLSEKQTLINRGSPQELPDEPEFRPQSLDTRLTEMVDKLPDSIKNLQMSSGASQEAESTIVNPSLVLSEKPTPNMKEQIANLTSKFTSLPSAAPEITGVKNSTVPGMEETVSNGIGEAVQQMIKKLQSTMNKDARKPTKPVGADAQTESLAKVVPSQRETVEPASNMSSVELSNLALPATTNQNSLSVSEMTSILNTVTKKSRKNASAVTGGTTSVQASAPMQTSGAEVVEPRSHVVQSSLASASKAESTVSNLTCDRTIQTEKNKVPNKSSTSSKKNESNARKTQADKDSTVSKSPVIAGPSISSLSSKPLLPARQKTYYKPTLSSVEPKIPPTKPLESQPKKTVVTKQHDDDLALLLDKKKRKEALADMNKKKDTMKKTNDEATARIIEKIKEKGQGTLIEGGRKTSKIDAGKEKETRVSNEDKSEERAVSSSSKCTENKASKIAPRAKSSKSDKSDKSDHKPEDLDKQEKKSKKEHKESHRRRSRSEKSESDYKEKNIEQKDLCSYKSSRRHSDQRKSKHDRRSSGEIRPKSSDKEKGELSDNNGDRSKTKSKESEEKKEKSEHTRNQPKEHKDKHKHKHKKSSRSKSKDADRPEKNSENSKYHKDRSHTDASEQIETTQDTHIHKDSLTKSKNMLSMPKVRTERACQNSKHEKDTLRKKSKEPEDNISETVSKESKEKGKITQNIDSSKDLSITKPKETERKKEEGKNSEDPCSHKEQSVAKSKETEVKEDRAKTSPNSKNHRERSGEKSKVVEERRKISESQLAVETEKNNQPNRKRKKEIRRNAEIRREKERKGNKSTQSPVQEASIQSAKEESYSSALQSEKTSSDKQSQSLEETLKRKKEYEESHNKKSKTAGESLFLALLDESLTTSSDEDKDPGRDKPSVSQSVQRDKGPENPDTADDVNLKTEELDMDVDHLPELSPVESEAEDVVKAEQVDEESEVLDQSDQMLEDLPVISDITSSALSNERMNWNGKDWKKHIEVVYVAKDSNYKLDDSGSSGDELLDSVDGFPLSFNFPLIPSVEAALTRNRRENILKADELLECCYDCLVPLSDPSNLVRIDVRDRSTLLYCDCGAQYRCMDNNAID